MAAPIPYRPAPLLDQPHDHELTQLELAQLVGSSRETINKALSEFANRGWIRQQGKTVFVLEAAKLARRAR